MQIFFQMLADAKKAGSSSIADELEVFAPQATDDNGVVFSALVDAELTKDKSPQEAPISVFLAETQSNISPDWNAVQVNIEEKRNLTVGKHGGASVNLNSENADVSGQFLVAGVGEAIGSKSTELALAENSRKTKNSSNGDTNHPANSINVYLGQGSTRSVPSDEEKAGTQQFISSAPTGNQTKDQAELRGEIYRPNLVAKNGEHADHMREFRGFQFGTGSEQSPKQLAPVAVAADAPKQDKSPWERVDTIETLPISGKGASIAETQSTKAFEPGADVMDSAGNGPLLGQVRSDTASREFTPFALPQSSQAANTRAPRAVETLQNAELRRPASEPAQTVPTNVSEAAKLMVQQKVSEVIPQKTVERPFVDPDVSLETLNTQKAEIAQPTRVGDAPKIDLQTRSVTSQIAQVIQRSAADGFVELRLQPEELGRVRMTMSQTDGGLIVHVVAERAETADLLRRNVDLLAQELRERGLTGSSFTFEQHQNKSDAHAEQERPRRDRQLTDADAPLLIAHDRAVSSSDGRVDIRI